MLRGRGILTRYSKHASTTSLRTRATQHTRSALFLPGAGLIVQALDGISATADKDHAQEMHSARGSQFSWEREKDGEGEGLRGRRNEKEREKERERERERRRGGEHKGARHSRILLKAHPAAGKGKGKGAKYGSIDAETTKQMFGQDAQATTPER